MRNLQLYWPVGFGLITLTASILYFRHAWDNPPVLYRIVFYYARQITFLLAVLFIPLSVFVMLRVLWRPQNKKHRLAKSGLYFGAILLISANLIACGAVLPLLLTPVTQVDKAYQGNVLYRLDSLFSPGVGGDHEAALILWECDLVGLFCRIIHTGPHYNNMVVELVQGEHNGLSLVINGNVAYKHEP